MADIATETPSQPAGHFVEPPPSEVPAPDLPLSSSDEISKLPLQSEAPEQTEAAPPEPTHPSRQPAPTEEAKPTESAKPAAGDLKPLFDIEAKPQDTPQKSQDAENLRKEAVPAHFKGKTAEHFNAAKEKWAGIVEAKDMQLQKAQKEHQSALATLQQENKRLEERVASLSGYESVIDFQSTDKFKNEILEPITRTENELIEYMKSRGSKPEGLEELKANIKDADYLYSAIAQLDKANPAIAARFRSFVEKLMDLRQKHDTAVADIKNNHQRYLDEKRGESVKQKAAFDTGLKATLDQHAKAMNGDAPAFPFLVKQKAPDGASAELIAKVDQHNTNVAQNWRDIEAAARSDDPAIRVKLAIGYGQAQLLMQQLEHVTGLLKERDDFIARVKSKTAPPSNATGGAAPNGSEQPPDMPLSELAARTFRPGR